MPVIRNGLLFVVLAVISFSIVAISLKRSPTEAYVSITPDDAIVLLLPDARRNAILLWLDLDQRSIRALPSGISVSEEHALVLWADLADGQQHFIGDVSMPSSHSVGDLDLAGATFVVTRETRKVVYQRPLGTVVLSGTQ